MPYTHYGRNGVGPFGAPSWMCRQPGEELTHTGARAPGVRGILEIEPGEKSGGFIVKSCRTP